MVVGYGLGIKLIYRPVSIYNILTQKTNSYNYSLPLLLIMCQQKKFTDNLTTKKLQSSEKVSNSLITACQCSSSSFQHLMEWYICTVVSVISVNLTSRKKCCETREIKIEWENGLKISMGERVLLLRSSNPDCRRRSSKTFTIHSIPSLAQNT